MSLIHAEYDYPPSDECPPCLGNCTQGRMCPQKEEPWDPVTGADAVYTWIWMFSPAIVTIVVLGAWAWMDKFAALLEQFGAGFR